MSSSIGSSHPGGFTPPPYPYARLAELAQIARGHEGGMVDLSIGTPCDPAPPAVSNALAHSGTEHGYPASLGSEALRNAAAGWVGRRFGISIDPSYLAACVGTKEFVASAAWYLRLRDPTRDMVLGPAVAYPTYEMSARLARCGYFAVPESSGGSLDLGSIPESVAERALVLWLNSPSNPTGALSNLNEAAAWGRARAVPVFSDECYAEFTWEPASPSTILSAGCEGVLAVHSLSKRSNMAGTRVGFYAGDPALTGYLSAVRQHAGLMVPGPVQAAAVAALEDDDHVAAQRVRYRERLELLVEILSNSGLDANLPAGGFYLWVPVPGWAEEASRRGSHETGAWALAESLAQAGGVLVSPGDLYGDAGARFVRIAVVQPRDRIELVGKRLGSASHPNLGGRASQRADRTFR